MCIVRGQYIRNPLEMYISSLFFFFFFIKYLLTVNTQVLPHKKWESLFPLNHHPQCLCNTLQGKDEDDGKWGVSSCSSLLGSNVCNSSFLTFSRCHGWIWAQNWSAFPHICSGCQRSHCQAGVLRSGEVSKQGHIAQILGAVYYSGIILINQKV